MSRIIKQSNQTDHQSPYTLLLHTFHKERDDEPFVETNEAVKAQTDTLVKNARTEAKRLLDEANAEIEAAKTAIQNERLAAEEEAKRLHEQARRSGEEEGYRDGLAKGHNEYSEQIAQATEVVQSAKVDYDAYLRHAEVDILDLACALAKKMTNVTMQEQEGYASFLKAAIQEVHEETEVLIHVHPSHYEATIQRRSEYEALFTIAERIRFFPDPNIEEDGCVILTPKGRMDASITTQLHRLKTELTALLEEGQGSANESD
ncbi:flagellar assembly protein FliH [Geomicrobium sediminis]|uniref:Flagellar assembly protein FliH n=1 Tax=Geomicrobium sediminis TaxID=1347788 RepID=A0ABS2PB64_9BACL|nr:flagellar assembly protein FliH [Geomicrobium sediminis]MBM7632591.1 flagellar assembly protein FliH [Geomicrobium sediminis]